MKKKKLERFGSFLTQKIDFESHNFAFLTTLTQLTARLKNFLKVGFGPKGKPGRMCNSVC